MSAQPFNTTPTCPKCRNNGPLISPAVVSTGLTLSGSFGFETSFMPAQGKMLLSGAISQTAVEYLKVTCRVCGFSFPMAPADAT